MAPLSIKYSVVFKWPFLAAILDLKKNIYFFLFFFYFILPKIRAVQLFVSSLRVVSASFDIKYSTILSCPLFEAFILQLRIKNENDNVGLSVLLRWLNFWSKKYVFLITIHKRCPLFLASK
jgi:hypothetical protein